jgi:hypothetical protein
MQNETEAEFLERMKMTPATPTAPEAERLRRLQRGRDLNKTVCEKQLRE